MSKCVFSVFLLEQTDVMASLGQFLPLVKHACGLTAAACYSISMSMTIRDFASSRQILYKFMSLIKSGHQIAICTVDLELFLTPECPSCCPDTFIQTMHLFKLDFRSLADF